MQSLHNKMCVMQNVQEGLDAGQNRLVRSDIRKQPLFFLKKNCSIFERTDFSWTFEKGQTFPEILRKAGSAFNYYEAVRFQSIGKVTPHSFRS